jgi:MFS family permease
VLAVASLGVFMAFVDATIVNVAFPDIERSFPGTSIAALSWVLSGYNIVFAAFLVAAGRLADLLGRRRVFLVGLVLFTAASGSAPARRRRSCSSPSASSRPSARRSSSRARWGSSSTRSRPSAAPMPSRCSPPWARSARHRASVGGLLVTVSDWRLVFLVNLPLGIAAWVLSRRHLVESRTPGRRRVPDLLGAVVFALAVSALVLGRHAGPGVGLDEPRGARGVRGVRRPMAVFVRRSAHHRAPVVDLRLLRDRTFSVANGMSVVASAGFFGYTLSNILFLTGVWGYSVLEAGLAVTPGPFVAAAVAGGGSRLAERHGHRLVLVGGRARVGCGGPVARAAGRHVAGLRGRVAPASVLLGVGAGSCSRTSAGRRSRRRPERTSPRRRPARGRPAGRRRARRRGRGGHHRHAGPRGGARGLRRRVDLRGGLSGGRGPRLPVRGARAGRAPSLAGAARAVLGPAGGAAAARAARAPRARAPAAARRRRRGADGPETPAQFLGRVPMLAGLAPEVLEHLAARGRTVEVAAGDWLFRQGDPGDATYVVRAGRWRSSTRPAASCACSGAARRSASCRC